MTKTISLDAFLAKQFTTNETLAALYSRGIKSTYWTVRRWRTNTGSPCGAMKQLLAQKGILA